MESPIWLLLPFVIALSPLFCPPRWAALVSVLALLAEFGCIWVAASHMSENAEGPEFFGVAIYFTFVGAVYLFCVVLRVIDEVVTRTIFWIKTRRQQTK